MIKRFFWFAIITVCALAVSCNSAPKEILHSALKIMNHYRPIHKGANTVIPYKVNMMALDLLQKKDASYIKECQYYIQWYLSHVNPADKYGLSGTIYDFEAFANGDENSLNTYESIDDCAASFILLIHRFYKVTGYSKVISQNSRKIRDIAYMLPYLQDKDGLVRPLPGTGRKYLKNNCEAYAAAGAFLELTALFGWEDRDLYQNTQTEIGEAILTNLYRPGQNEFFWMSDNRGKYAPDWKVLTPDSYSQLFPLLYHVLPGHIDIRPVWEKFRKFHDEEAVLKSDAVQGLVYRWTAQIMGEKKK
jgi:hypothetical protein